MISNANTIVDPRAVVVKPLYTLITDATMARPVRSNDFVVRAKQHWVKLLHHLHKCYVLWLCDVAWIRAHAAKVQDDGSYKESQLEDD